MKFLTPIPLPSLRPSTSDRLQASVFVLATAFALVCLATPPANAHPPSGPSPEGVLSLDVLSEGETLHLLLGVDGENSPDPQLRYLRSTDAGQSWSDPSPVGAEQAPPFSPSRGMDPQVAGRGERIVAAWTTAGTGFFGSGPIATALSRDGGLSWEAGPNPADHDSTDGHGFMDLAVDREGRFHLVWLDSRDGQQGLHHAQSTDGGRSWSANSTLDPETCECCWNTLATGPDGELGVLYREKSPRDMALIARESGPGDAVPAWSPPVAVGAFGWEFDGCPHAGGGLAITGSGPRRRTHAAVWTGHENRAGVYYLSAGDDGPGWSEPKRLEGGMAGHPDLSADARGRVAAVWTSPEEGTRRVRAARLDPASGEWSATESLSDPGADASHPKVVTTPVGFRVFWTESSGENAAPVWRSARLESDS